MQTPTKKPHPAGVTASHNSRVNYSIHDPMTEITSRLKGVTKRHNGGMLAFCPSHDDRKSRSLAVSLGSQGQVLLYCFAGCAIHEITAAIGLDPANLFPPSDDPRYRKQSRSGFSAWQMLNVLRADLVRLLIIASDLKKINALSVDDRQFIGEVILRIDSGLSYLKGSK